MNVNDTPVEIPGTANKEMVRGHIPQRFNIRVYGLLIWNEQLLVSDEFIRGSYFTKFPGGGLEFGEGTRECLKREFMEETGLDITVGQHVYTTDFFQISAFNNKDQIISIYYFVDAVEAKNLATKTEVFDFNPGQLSDPSGQSEVFRWIPLNQLHADCVTLPIDKLVVNQLLEYLPLQSPAAP